MCNWRFALNRMLGSRTELDVDEALLSRQARENICLHLHCLARISWQKGQKQASSLCFRRERVEGSGNLGEVSGDHFGECLAEE